MSAATANLEAKKSPLLVQVAQLHRTVTLYAAAVALMFLLAAVLGLVLYANYVDADPTGALMHTNNGLLAVRYGVQSLNGGGAPVLLVLPSDAGAHVGRTYHVYSTTAQPHVVQIEAGGATWDGSTATATLGGAPGDGLTFVVVDRSLVVVTHSRNVAFSA